MVGVGGNQLSAYLLGPITIYLLITLITTYHFRRQDKQIEFHYNSLHFYTPSNVCLHIYMDNSKKLVYTTKNKLSVHPK